MADQPPSVQPPSGPPAGGPPPGYGYQQPAPGYYPHPGYYAQQRPGNGIAIAAMVCGIVALVFCWIPFVNVVSIVLGALAIVFGFIGNNRAAQLAGAGRGMAIAGLVCGIVAVAVSILFLVIFGIAVHNVTTSPDFTFGPVPT